MVPLPRPLGLPAHAGNGPLGGFPIYAYYYNVVSIEGLPCKYHKDIDVGSALYRLIIYMPTVASFQADPAQIGASAASRGAGRGGTGLISFSPDGTLRQLAWH